MELAAPLSRQRLALAFSAFSRPCPATWRPLVVWPLFQPFRSHRFPLLSESCPMLEIRAFSENQIPRRSRSPEVSEILIPPPQSGTLSHSTSKALQTPSADGTRDTPKGVCPKMSRCPGIRTGTMSRKCPAMSRVLHSPKLLAKSPHLPR